ncbi:MAG: DNA-3-methyladenine glycosylase [Patescibacteria group bacterium]|nr:DNA-3-methyladenine glycosylase [Patescibacteria group bacterium]
MRRALKNDFFERPTLAVARDLLGKYLVRRKGGKTEAFLITEVEAYDGWHDRASHAHRGETERNAPMFRSAGRWYIYLCYGMHWMLNVVTGPSGYPAAVLIRGVEGVNGPARVTKRLSINRTQNDKPAVLRSGLWVEDRGFIVSSRLIGRSPRIGVDYAGEWARKKYRFFLKNHELSLRGVTHRVTTKQ